MAELRDRTRRDLLEFASVSEENLRLQAQLHAKDEEIERLIQGNAESHDRKQKIEEFEKAHDDAHRDHFKDYLLEGIKVGRLTAGRLRFTSSIQDGIDTADGKGSVKHWKLESSGLPLGECDAETKEETLEIAHDRASQQEIDYGAHFGQLFSTPGLVP